MKRILFTAAHSGFDLGEVPLGGGASVCQHLVQEWARTRPFEFKILGPSLLGSDTPRHKDLVRFSEFQYARFCRIFEQKLTEAILREDPKTTVVLSNDISEGPDFKLLAEKGYSIFTIYHVDVVDYFTRMYLKSWIKPERTTALFRNMERWGLAPFMPGVLKLIWAKQEASVRKSRGLIVPSQRMKDILLRGYPGLEPSHVHVLPWGVWEDPVSASEIQEEKKLLVKQYPITPQSIKLLTLSRISPEKGQDRLLKALALWERQPDYPKEGVSLFIAGESAYMMGERFEEKLKELSAKLRRCQVHFVGYAAGAKKKALFEFTDLYVFPSRHESYGLTLLEALREGKAVLATPSHGALEVFRPEFGELTPACPESVVPEHVMNGLRRLVAERSRWKEMGQAASVWAGRQKFSESAARLADLLIGS